MVYSHSYRDSKDCFPSLGDLKIPLFANSPACPTPPPGLVGGLAGGATVFGVRSSLSSPESSSPFKLGSCHYHFSGAKSIVNAASPTKNQFNKLSQNIQSSAPEPSDALKWLRSTATSHAALFPGAQSYVDSAFNGFDKVQVNHGKEVEEIVNNAYKELKAATKSGMSVETASKSREIL